MPHLMPPSYEDDSDNRSIEEDNEYHCTLNLDDNTTLEIDCWYHL